MTESKKSFKVKWWLGTTDGDNRAPAALAEAGDDTGGGEDDPPAELRAGKGTAVTPP